MATHNVVIAPSCFRTEAMKIANQIGTLGTAIHAVPEIVQGIETALDEKELIGLWMEGPRATQDDQFDLVHWMTNGSIGLQAAPGLEIGIEVVDGGPLGTGFVGQVALRHSDIVGAEYAAPRAGMRPRQHGHGSHATLGSYRTHPQSTDEDLLVDFDFTPRPQVANSCDQLSAREEAPTIPGMSPKNRFDHRGRNGFIRFGK